MLCPTCQTVAPEKHERCPACGAAQRSVAPDDVVATVATVEASVTIRESGKTALPSYAVELSSGRSEGREMALIVAQPEARRLPVLARLPELPALAWSQPAVRAAVKMGAGALALSLVVRTARQMLARSGRAAAPLEGVLPRLLTETLRPAEPAPRRGSVRRGPAVEVTEVFIYTRRVVRR